MHTAKKPEPEIPERVKVPDFANRLPEPIQHFTTKGVYDPEEDAPVVHARRRPRRLAPAPRRMSSCSAWSRTAIRSQRDAIRELDLRRPLRARVGAEGRRDRETAGVHAACLTSARHPGSLPTWTPTDECGRRLRRGRGVEAVVHRRRRPRPHPQPSGHRIPEQPMSTFNVVEAAVRFGVPLRQHLERERCPGSSFRSALSCPTTCPWTRTTPSARRTPMPFEVLRRAAHGRRGAPVGPALHLHQAVLGAARGQLRAQPGAAGARPLGPEPTSGATSTSTIWPTPSSWPRVRAARPRGLLHRLARQRRGRPFAEMVRKYYGDALPVRALAREDASGISSAKAMRMLGYAPKRSWRDYLDQPSFSASASSSSTTDAHCARIASGERSSPWVATLSASRYCRSSRRHHTSVSVTEER